MDFETRKHLDTWITMAVPGALALQVKASIVNILTDHPDLIKKGYSWPEIRNLSER